MTNPLPQATRPRLQAVMVAFAVAFTATMFDWVLLRLASETRYRVRGEWPDTVALSATARDFAFLVFGALLALTHPKRSGLTLGTGRNKTKALAACAVIIGSVLLYRIFSNDGSFDDWTVNWSIWTVSALAQELVFTGFILGLLNEYFPRWWHPAAPMTTAVAITALLFGMWHFIPDYGLYSQDMGFVLFRFAYTAGGWILYAWTRLWTGTILYAVFMHVAVNFIVLGT